ncbi:unnamed protein product [Rotaria sp. Silwood2]|nr:unnamed protein product [Rotaria sp. Silwood2]
MNKIRADHNLEIPFLPTNRIFYSSYSAKSKMLFSDFERYLIENYKDRWTKQYNPILVSMKPQQLKFDILGFAFEYTKEKRRIIESHNIEPANTTSSCNYLGSFKANTIICGEVTTSTLTFNNNDFLLLEMNISSNSSNPQTTQATFKLLNKLIQLERCVAFILKYYKNITLEQIIAVLFGRLDLIWNKFNYIKKFLRTINDPWIYESNLSLQPEALERVKADANQSTESVSREEIILIY